MKEFLSLKDPNELLEFISKNIKYGYLTKTGNLALPSDDDFDSNWYNNYVLERPEQLLDNLVGNCFDQVELEREWFSKNNYEYKTIFEMVNLDYKNDYPTHTFLVYKDENNNWNWFENSDVNNKGIHKFNTLDELIKYQYEKYTNMLKEYNISLDELRHIVLVEYEKPNSGISAREYLEFVLNGKHIDI